MPAGGAGNTVVFVKPVWTTQLGEQRRSEATERELAKHSPFQEQKEPFNSCDPPTTATSVHWCTVGHYSSAPCARGQPVLFLEARHRPVWARDGQPVLILTRQRPSNRRESTPPTTVVAPSNRIWTQDLRPLVTPKGPLVLPL